ncbi:MAG: Citrate transporter, partial [uncultured bacterium]
MSHELIWTVLGGLFIIGYIAIVLEHKLHINKSGTAIALGALSWLFVSWAEKGNAEVGLALSHETQEIFGIVVFLLAAMTIVEVLVHYHFFDWVERKIMHKKLAPVQLFWLLGVMTFVFSAFLDNLTATLVMLQIGRKVYKHKDNFLIFAANTVIAANAGGVASPIGDVTTIMLWLAHKFTALQVITIGILPSIVTWIIPQFLLGKKIHMHKEIEAATETPQAVDTPIHEPYWPIVVVAGLAFTLPVAVNLMGLPPFLGLLAGVGALWVFIDILAKKDEVGHHKNSQVVKVIQNVDISTLKFFIGILLAVGALSHVGLLKELNTMIFGESPSIVRLIGGNTILGFASSVLDNVPLVAAAIKMFSDDIIPAIWVLLALTAGTGGSMLVVGSAAGVAAMGQVKDLTFGY